MTVNVLEWVLSASALIVVVMLLRGLLGKRISAGLRYGLWAVVLVRLLVPVSFFSLPVAVPQIPTWTPPATMQEESIYVLPVDIRPVENSSVHVFEDGTLGDPNSFGYPKLSDDGETVVRYADKISPLELLKWGWIAGTAAMGIMLVVSNLRFSRRLRRVRRPMERTNTPIQVYVASALPSPCLIGLLFPAVYVTEEAVADTTMLRHVLAHELTHYSHRDHLWSVLRGAALAVHWWNPLVWLAVVCSRRDGELACDEGALKQLGDSERTAYGETLLTLVTVKARPIDLLSFATTMTGGKRSLKERIQRIAHQPKQFVSAVVAVVIMLSLSVLVAFGQAKEPWIDPDSVTGFTAFTASSYTTTPERTIVYTPADLQKDLQMPKDAARLSQEDGIELIHLINTHRKSVYGQGDLTLDGMEHHFVRIDCADGGFYLVDYWYWNGFSLNPLHAGEDDYTTLITYFDADGNAGTTWQMEYSFDSDYRRWQVKTRDTTASGSDSNWQNTQITLDESGVPHIIYTSSDSPEEVTGNPIPAPREWADDDLAGRNEAAALIVGEEGPEVWAKMVSPTEGWLVACYGRGVAAADTYVYKTSDAGLNWTEVTMPGTSWHIADVGFLNPDRLIVAQRLFNDAPCFITKDGGETWEEIELPDVQVLSIDSIADTVYMDIGAHESDPATFTMTSSDMGDNWTISSPAGLRRIIQADLDHEGLPDMLTLGKREESGFTLWKLAFTASYMSTPTWEGEAATPHVGWTAFFLCRMEGEEYLLQYTPYMGGGSCYYSYKLFYLTANGEEVVVQENSVEFDINFGSAQHQYDPEAINAFMEEINALLANSELLVNTDENLIGTFQKEGRLYDSIWWLDDIRDDQLTLLGNLLNYESYAGDHPDDTWSPLVDFLLDATEEDVAALNVTEALRTEFIRYLREAKRVSRFYTWKSYNDAYDGHGVGERPSAVCEFTLTDGKMLHLFASAENDNVLIMLESSGETVTAFYEAPGLNRFIHETPIASDGPLIEQS